MSGEVNVTQDGNSVSPRVETEIRLGLLSPHASIGPEAEFPAMANGRVVTYVIDPDGNNVEAVYHGPTRRSAASVVVTPA